MSIPSSASVSLGETSSDDGGSWIAAHFGAGILPPFSFRYAGKPSESFIRGWEFNHESEATDGGRTEHVFTYTDPETQLQVRCECSVFKEFPAIEWVVKLKNGGKDDTPFLDDIQALDVIHGISLYLPSTSTGCGYPDPYIFRSSMNNGLVIGWNLYQEDFPVEQARRLVEELRRVRHLFFGDFYPLTPHRVTDDAWMAYQFHREDRREGMVLAFRRPHSPYVTARLALKGLSPAARYELAFEDSGGQRACGGSELADGLEVTIESVPGSVLITYRQLS
jgi:hypothetical protein